MLVTALGACGAAGLLVSQAAFGRAEDKACDQVVCAQWGIEGNASRLWIENAAASGGATITSEMFTDTIGTTFTGVAGTTACQAVSIEISCNAPIAPGASFFADILAQGGNPPVGTTGTVTVSTGTLSYRTAPDTITVTLDSSLITSSSKSTSTSQPPCQPKLVLTKTVHAEPRARHVAFTKFLRREEGPKVPTWVTWEFPSSDAFLIFAITVTNDGDCVARNVKVWDEPPAAFKCDHVLVAPPPKGNKVHGGSNCHGIPEEAVETIADLAPGETARVYLLGHLDREGKLTNTAEANAKNAPKVEKSNPVAVDVLSTARFMKP
jgi:hypothetical protein